MSDLSTGLVIVVVVNGNAWPAWVMFQSSGIKEVDRVVDVTKAPGLSNSDRQRLFELAQQCVIESGLMKDHPVIDLRQIYSKLEDELARGWFGGNATKIRKISVKIYRANLALGSLVHEILWAAADRKNNGNSRGLNSDEVETANISDIQPGPVRHQQLTDEQMKRIRRIHQTFQEVYPISLEKTIENFKRDIDPEPEIVIWERMAEAYTVYLRKHKLSLEEKKAVYEILLLRSAAPERYVLENLQNRVFSEEKIKEIMRYYQVTEQPFIVEEKHNAKSLRRDNLVWNAKGYSPYGIAAETGELFRQKISINEEKTNVSLIEYIVIKTLIEPFEDTNFPFGCVLLGCAQEPFVSEFKEYVGKIIGAINQDQGEKIVTAEILTFNVKGGGKSLIGVILPTRSLPPEDKASYQKANLLVNYEQMKETWNWCRGILVKYVLPANKTFLLFCLAAQNEEILNRKLGQIEQV